MAWAPPFGIDTGQTIPSENGPKASPFTMLFHNHLADRWKVTFTGEKIKPMRWNLRFIEVGLLSLCCGALHAAPLQIALGENKPPYISTETRSGVEYELVTRALQDAGVEFEIQHLPNKRARLLFSHGQLDAAIATEGGIVSEPYIAYKNMAITLCDQQIKLSKTTDLAPYQTGAFNNASKFLGADFTRIAADLTHYREISPQKLMNGMLMARRIDVAIADINIFQHDQQELDPQGSKALCPFAIFAPTLYRIEFRNAAIRDRFNQALAQLRANGFYEALAKKYKLPLDRQRPYFKP